MTDRELYRKYLKIAISNGISERLYRQRIHQDWSYKRASCTPVRSRKIVRRAECTECVKGKRAPGSMLCQDCNKKHQEKLRQNYIDVETDDEPRIDFLIRKSKELGLPHTKKDINVMIFHGMTDDIILKTKPKSVWTRGSETDLGAKVSYHNYNLGG